MSDEKVTPVVHVDHPGIGEMMWLGQVLQIADADVRQMAIRLRALTLVGSLESPLTAADLRLADAVAQWLAGADLPADPADRRSKIGLVKD